MAAAVQVRRRCLGGRPIGLGNAPAAKRAKKSHDLFMMGAALPPVPDRAVGKIGSREYIDFAELLGATRSFFAARPTAKWLACRRHRAPSCGRFHQWRPRVQAFAVFAAGCASSPRNGIGGVFEID